MRVNHMWNIHLETNAQNTDGGIPLIRNRSTKVKTISPIKRGMATINNVSTDGGYTEMREMHLGRVGLCPLHVGVKTF